MNQMKNQFKNANVSCDQLNKSDAQSNMKKPEPKNNIESQSAGRVNIKLHE